MSMLKRLYGRRGVYNNAALYGGWDTSAGMPDIPPEYLSYRDNFIPNEYRDDFHSGLSAAYDIDTARAQLAKERAEAKIASAETQRDIKIANAALARAMARLKAASK